MKTITGILFFALTVFPHSIELVSPRRSPSQTDMNEEAGPSGHEHLSDDEPVGVLYQYPTRRRFNRIDNLFYEKDGELVPLRTGQFISARMDDIVIGKIIDGYVRPMYNADRKIVMFVDNGNRQITVSLSKAERMGVNEPVPRVFLNHPR